MQKIHTVIPQRSAIAAAALVALFGSAHAADWEVSGFVRQELAVKTTDDQNSYNTNGGDLIGVARPYRGLPIPGAPATLQEPASFANKTNINWFATRLDLNLDGKLSETLKATVKLRAVVDETASVDDSIGTRTTSDGIHTGAGNILAGSSFGQQFGGTAGGPLAYATGRALVDLPAAYIDYNQGPLWIRAGNQQIAWGEALFFRVADQPNGLDLRGHLFGVGAEEYSDTRRSSLGLRGNFRVTETLDVDGFVQRFAPTLLMNAETAYNLVQSQFTVDQKTGYDEVKNQWNAGFRLKGEAGGFGYQAFALSRINPDGLFKWKNIEAGSTTGALPGTPFAYDPNGGYSSGQWFAAASAARLDGTGAVVSALNGILATSPLFGPAGGVVAGCQGFVGGGGSATPGAYTLTPDQAACVLDTFYASGSLRGWLTREYKRETVVGGGVNHVFEGAPDSLLDQLIGRFEFSYTPNKHFTHTGLADYVKTNEYQFAFIFEKYHKFVSSVPATYFVAQWLHKSKSDMFGRYLGGVDNTPGTVPNGQSGGFNALVLAFQQPSPTLEYRFDFALLTDLKGGWYLQPGVKWKPTKSIQADLYLNAVYSQNKGQYKDFVDGMQNNNEVFARLSYQF